MTSLKIPAVPECFQWQMPFVAVRDVLLALVVMLPSQSTLVACMNARINDCPSIDTLSLEWNDRQLTVDIFICVFLEEVFQIEVVEVLVLKFINSYSWGPFH